MKWLGDLKPYAGNWMVDYGQKSCEQNESLIGVIAPVMCDDDQMTEAALVVTDEEEYRIENRAEFINHLQQYITAVPLKFEKTL